MLLKLFIIFRKNVYLITLFLFKFFVLLKQFIKCFFINILIIVHLLNVLFQFFDYACHFLHTLHMLLDNQLLTTIFNFYFLTFCIEHFIRSFQLFHVFKLLIVFTLEIFERFQLSDIDV